MRKSTISQSKENEISREGQAVKNEGGRIRGVPVKIGGSSYIPPLPMEYEVKEQIEMIVAFATSPVGIAIELALYVMKTQIFNDGNKRTAIIFANHYLIAHGGGLMVVPSKSAESSRTSTPPHARNARKS